MGDSPDNTGDATAPKESGRGSRLSGLPGCLAAIGLILFVFVGLPYAFLVLLFWVGEGSSDFEGDRNFRYWLFVSGKRAEKLGLVTPTEKPVKYSVSGSDGNFPGWTVVQYESKAGPADVIAAYAERCESLKAKVIERPASEPKEGTIAAYIECEFAGYLTADFFAERTSSSPVTEVSLRVWGME
jgi:hypothetical protein